MKPIVPVLFYDTETTGLPNWSVPSDDPSQPHITQLAAELYDVANMRTLGFMDTLIKPAGWTVPEEIQELTGISTELCERFGVTIVTALDMFLDLWHMSNFRCGHNESFDMRMIRIAMMQSIYDKEAADVWKEGPAFCTQSKSVKIINLPPTPKMIAVGRRTPDAEVAELGRGVQVLHGHRAGERAQRSRRPRRLQGRLLWHPRARSPRRRSRLSTTPVCARSLGALFLFLERHAMLTIERVPAKVVAVTPMMLKHGKKQKMPAQKITLEFLLKNTDLDHFDTELRPAFYRPRSGPVVDTSKRGGRGKQINVDLSSTDMPDLRMPWITEWISIVGKILVGYVITFHTSISGDDIVLNVEKADKIAVLMKGDGNFLMTIQVLVKPTHLEKGRIEDMLSNDMTTSLIPPEDPVTAENLFRESENASDDDDVVDAEFDPREQPADGERPENWPLPKNGEIVDEDPFGMGTDPFAGSDLARGKGAA